MDKWERFLNQYFCYKNSQTGNRPCDSGRPCDNCKTEQAQQQYAAWLSKAHEQWAFSFGPKLSEYSDN